MDTDTLRKVQLTQLEIFKQVRSVAEAHGITLFLAYGTLLGAVRHKGFIPWDDDLDVVVRRDEYDRLMRVLKDELSEPYTLQSYDTDARYWQGFAKVRKKGTLYKEQATSALPDETCGIWIDIFPLDDAKRGRGWPLRFRKYLAETVGFAIQRRVLKRSFSCFSRRYAPIMLFWGLFPTKVLQRLQTCFIRKKCKRQAAWLVNVAGTDRIQKETFRAEWFAESVKLPFEDTLCDVPCAYDALLTHFYGDYMTPPPEGKRGGHNADERFPIIV